MRRHCLALLLLLPSLTWADPVPPSWDENRRAGFREHQQQEKVFDRERLKGERAFIEEQEEWERQRQASIADYKKESKTASPSENGPEYKEYLKEAEAEKKARRQITQEYSREKAAVAKRTTGKGVKLTEEEELGLTQTRPRYDVGRRVLYGAPSKFATGGASRGGGSRSNSRFTPPPASFGGNAGGFTPPPAPPVQDGDLIPPPMFDDGGGEDIPPPPPVEYDDLPPPLPPGDAFDPDDFPPPPDFGDFPPPPPPMDGGY